MARILGVDYGEKRIGLAISDELEMVAMPVGVIHRTNEKEDIAKIRELILEKKATLIVFGLPINMDGTPGKLGAATKAFAVKLTEAVNLPVDYYDERLTTLEAERMLTDEADISRAKRKGVKDKLAASLILQSYMEIRKANS